MGNRRLVLCFAAAVLLSGCTQTDLGLPITDSGAVLSGSLVRAVEGVRDTAADVVSAGELIRNEYERRSTDLTQGVKAVKEGTALIRRGLDVSGTGSATR